VKLLRYSLLLGLVLALLVPAAAPAGPIDDCADDGILQGDYSAEEKRRALKDLPSDLSEYSDCAALLQGGRRGSSAPSIGGGGAGSAAPRGSAPRPINDAAREAARLRRARREVQDLAQGGGRPELQLGGRTISPGEAGLFDLASSTHPLPSPLKLALIALAALLLAMVVGGVLRLLPASARERLGRFLEPLRRVPGLRR